MPKHWLDANVFIEPKNGCYAFDIVPGYWTWIERQAAEGRIRSPMAVYRELVLLEGEKDQLARWAQAHKDSLFVEADAIVQAKLREVANYVNANHDAANAAQFMQGADPWLIAHAAVDVGTVVTIEKLRNRRKVQIPKVCDNFGVPYIGLYKMLHDLGASFVERTDGE